MDVHEGIRRHDKATIRLTGLCGNDGFELGPVANRGCGHLHSGRLSGGFEGGQEKFGIWRRLNESATRATRGAISLSSSSHLPDIVGSILVKPVTLPPG